MGAGWSAVDYGSGSILTLCIDLFTAVLEKFLSFLAKLGFGYTYFLVRAFSSFVLIAKERIHKSHLS